MRVLIDARTVRPGRTGVGVATEEIVRAMDGLLVPPRAPSHYSSAISSSSADPDATGISFAGPRAPSVDALILPRTLGEWSPQGPLHAIQLLEEGVDYQRHPASEWDQLVGLPSRLRQGEYSHYWGVAFALPFRSVPGCVMISTVHDLAAFTHPRCFPARFAWLMRQQIRNTVRRADWIHVPTAFVADELVQWTGFSRSRILVSHLGVNSAFSPWPESKGRSRDPQLPEALRTEQRPWILAPGGLDPRKNVERLIEAFATLVAANPSLPHVLVLMGQLPARPVPPQVADRIIPLGRLGRDQVRALYRHAELLAFISLTEGFGLPVLEAMACGCPVVAGREGSLPEVADTAAHLVNPLDVSDMALGLETVLCDSEFRDYLRQAGLERSRQFTWTETVRPILECVTSK